MTSGLPKIVLTRIRESRRDSMVKREIEIEETVDDEILITTTSFNSAINRIKRGESL
jgi:hypothetical protein